MQKEFLTVFDKSLVNHLAFVFFVKMETDRGTETE